MRRIKIGSTEPSHYISPTLLDNMPEENSGVLIGDDRASVRLTRDGEPNELGYPTIIDVRAGPFQGTIRDNLLDFGLFLSQLEALYKSLSGDAKLGSYEGFELDLIGNGLGAIEVRGRVIGQHVPLIQLTYAFDIDQSYLPTIIQKIDTEFPAPYRDLSPLLPKHRRSSR